jgi:hypothetical protein
VVLNTTVPSSQLKKKHNAIAYHRVREAIAGGIIRFGKIDSKDNLADVLTKPLPSDIFLGLITPVLFRKPMSFIASTETNSGMEESCLEHECGGAGTTIDRNKD